MAGHLKAPLPIFQAEGLFAFPRMLEQENSTMSPEVGKMLIKEVEPRIRSQIHGFVPVGTDDQEEQCQDAIATAAQLLHSIEARAKTGVSAGNVAHFAIRLVKSGRRSTGSKPDPLHPVAILSGRSRPVSLDAPLNCEADGEETLCLHDALAAKTEDPAAAAIRRLDWDKLLSFLDAMAREVLRCLMQDQDLTTLVPKLKRSRSSLQGDKMRLARLVKEHLGEDITRQVQEQPRWRDCVHASRERSACRYERQSA
jgi:hypothetical protein